MNLSRELSDILGTPQRAEDVSLEVQWDQQNPIFTLGVQPSVGPGSTEGGAGPCPSASVPNIHEVTHTPASAPGIGGACSAVPDAIPVTLPFSERQSSSSSLPPVLAPASATDGVRIRAEELAELQGRGRVEELRQQFAAEIQRQRKEQEDYNQRSQRVHELEVRRLLDEQRRLLRVEAEEALQRIQAAATAAEQHAASVAVAAAEECEAL